MNLNDRGRVSVDDIAEVLLGSLRAQRGSDAPAPDRHTALADLGVDSLSLIKLMLAIEQRFGIWIPDEALTPEAVASVDNLARQALSCLQGAPDPAFGGPLS